MKNPDLPPAFEALYRRALNANPLARPKTAGEFAAEFSAILAKGPGGPRAALPAEACAGQLGAVARTARSAEKPPPPVPTDQLPIASVSPPGGAPSASGRKSRPGRRHPAHGRGDAGRSSWPRPAAPRKPEAASSARRHASRGVAPGKAARPRPRPPFSHGLADPPRPRVLPGSQPRPRPRARASGARSSRREEAWRSGPCPVLWLVLLTIAGLATGSGVGLPAAQALGPQVHARGHVTPQAPPQPPARASKATPTRPEPEGNDPMAPSGVPRRHEAGERRDLQARRAPGRDPDKMFDERQLESVSGRLVLHRRVRVPQPAGRGAPRQRELGSRRSRPARSEASGCAPRTSGRRPARARATRASPTGTTSMPSRCNTEDAEGKDRALARIGPLRSCRSGYGVADLSGNVAEWTASRLLGRQPEAGPRRAGPSTRPGYAVRCSARMSGAPTEPEAHRGFPVLRGRAAMRRRRGRTAAGAAARGGLRRGAVQGGGGEVLRAGALRLRARRASAPRPMPTCRR